MGLIPVLGKIPWRRAWQPTPVFLPGESHGQRSQAGYSPLGCKESDMTEATQHAHTNISKKHYVKVHQLATKGFNLASLRVGFPGGSNSKESSCSAEGLGSIPGLGRSLGGGNGNPLQHSCLENPMDRGAWRGTVHGVTKSRIWLSNLAQHSLMSAMAIHTRPPTPSNS